MTDLQTIVTEPGLSFDVLASGPADAPLVLLLHGFAESFHTWREQIEALAAAGYRAVAPSQRTFLTSWPISETRSAWRALTPRASSAWKA